MLTPENSQKSLDQPPSLPRYYDAIFQDAHLSCAVEVTIKMISGRWKVLIFRELLQGKKRFNELHRALEGITYKVLAQQLRDMEQDGLITRKDYQQVPPKVEYYLTPLGESLHGVIDVMHRWGKFYLNTKHNTT